jgi:hypothetical protein
MVREAALRPNDIGGMWRRGIAFTRRETGAALKEQLKLDVDHYLAAVDAGMGLANRMLQAIFWPDRRGAGDGAPAGGPAAKGDSAEEAPRRGQLVFAEEFGREARCSFAVSNRTEERRLVRFEISEFVREGSEERFRVPMVFLPAELALEPGEQRVVQAGLALGDPFTPGLTHFALVRVVGFPGMELAVVAAPRSPDALGGGPETAAGRGPSGETVP